MDIELIKLVFSGGQFVLTCAIGVWLYFDRRGDKTNERISSLQEAVDGRLDSNASRLAHLEARVAGAPTHGDLSKVYDRLNNVAESVGRLEGETKTQSDLLRLILGRVADRKM